MCRAVKYAKLLSFFVRGFNVKLFGNISPRGALTERSRVELSSARMFDAASVVEHMPLCVSARLRSCGLFSELQL